VFNPFGRPLTEDELIPLLRDCDGYIAGVDFVTKKVIAACDNLKVISRYGVGFDRVDLEAARSKNIAVCNTPGANSQAVADLAFAHILCLARLVLSLDRKTREGEWPRSIGMGLNGKTIGILGLGAVGKAVVKRALGFSMKVLAYDHHIDLDFVKQNGIEASDFDTLIHTADIITLHLPLTGVTKGIISRQVMADMKKGVILINTARGGLIDEDAAYEYLRSGHLDGLGLDVYEEEPPKQSPLFALENVVLTPHTAAHTAEATANMASMSVENLIDVLTGKLCPHRVV
jgi:D-3-phosphoglycerate dehydrogenase